MKSKYASPLMLALCLLIGACSTMAPPKASLAPPPADLMVPAPPLQKLPGAGPVSPRTAATVVIQNYGLYHDIANRLQLLQQYVKDNSK